MPTNPAFPPALDDQLCFALYGASMAVGRLYKPMLDRLGITYPQYLVLSVLWDTDGQTIGAVADRLMLESSTITPLVKRLAAIGVIERRRNPEDERQVIVRLTDTGRKLRKECTCLGESLIEASNIPLQSLQVLNEQVRQIRDAVAAASKKS